MAAVLVYFFLSTTSNEATKVKMKLDHLNVAKRNIHLVILKAYGFSGAQYNLG